MVRETHNVCFGQIAQETQVAVKEDTTAVKRDHLKRSTDELSISNYTERNSGYYERSSRLVADTDSYIRRPNHSTSVINNYQTSSNSNINNSASINSNSDSNNNNNNRNRTTRDCRLYRNGPYAISSRTASPSTVLLSDRSVSVATSNNTNSRVPPASWYEATATYTNGPGGSGNAGVSAAGNPATSYSNSPAHNNSATATAISLRNHSSVYGNVTSALALDSGNSNRAIEISNILSNKGVGNNSSKYQRLLKLSSAPRSGSASPTTITGPATMTASSLSATTATKSSCSSFSSTINSNTNNNNLSSSISSVADTNTTASNASGILNAAALAAAAVSESNEVQSNNINTNTNNTGNNNINSLSNASNSSNNPSSASHHTSRSVAHAHLHGRSTTSSSRSHSRSPSSYSSSHSSSSSSSSASSNSHASSPTAIRDVDNSVSTSRVGPRSLQSAVAVPNSTIPSALNTSGCSIGGNGNSNNSSSGTPIGNPVVHSEDNRPLAIRVRNLPARSSDTSLKDGLFHEYKKHGKVTWVKVVGQNAERYALVCFKKPEDVEKALEVSHDKLFFGCKIEVEPYQGYDVEDNEFRPYEAELDEYHPKSTRTLFIGNLEKDITASELRSHFECFGEIIEIDIKKQGTSAYAFCQYSDIVSVVKAMRKMDGEHLGNNRIKLGFGKSMPTNCVWIDGIAEKISESHLQSQFSRYGAVSKVVIDRLRQLALVLYEQIQYAQTAVKEMRGATLRGRKLQVDFASRECQDAFYDKLDKQTASSRFNRYDSQSRSRASSFSRHQNSNDGCSPSNTPGSSSSSSAGGGTAPALPSAIVSNSMSTSFAMGPLSSVVGQTSGNSTPARSRGSRSSRHTMDYDYLDSRRFRSYDEYSQGSGASHDEDAPPGAHIAPGGSYSGIGLRSDSPLLSRLGPIVNSNKEPNEVIEVSLSSRRRCDKSPGKQKGDIRIFQKERSHLLEQLEECPSSGDENIVSPRKRIKIDHHSINSNCGLSQPHMLDEQPQHKNSNCDYILHDSIHRKGEVRRLSECSNLSKYPQQTHHHHHSHHSLPHHHHHQQQLSRRPSIDILATGGSLSARHGSTSSTSSNSDHHPPPYQSSTSLPCKRRRIISGGGNVIASNTLVSSSGSGLAPSLNDDYHHHASRGRGHQLHSQHSHEASGGESADGSRPGTPLCDERPEVLPSEPRRVPRDRPREPMVLPLPKFGIHFFQQYRNSMTSNSSSSLMPSSTTYHHHGSSSFASASAASSTASGSSHILSNSLLSGGGGVSNNNVHSSLSHSFSTATSASSVAAGSSSSYLPSPPTRFPAQWRPHHHHQHHNHGHHSQQHHHTGTTPSSSSSAMISPLRSRSLSSNSSDSDVPGQSSTGSPSLEERIRTLDEMYERWSGGSATSNVIKRHDFNHAPPIWQQNRSVLSADLHHSNSNEIKLNAPSVPASRHKFLDIDVNELQPSEIVKSVLAKKSIFDDDLQRLKKNHWYEPSSDISQLAKNTSNICTSPGLPNLAATKAPVVGCTSNVPNSTGSTLSKPPGGLLQRLSSVSPMNSPQTSMSPYNSPSPSPSITGNVQLLSSITKVTSYTSLSGVISHPPTANSLTSLNSGASSKGLQYPFPSHPPLPSTAAPVEIQPQVPPSSSSAEIVALSKPKTSALSKSLSVPTTSTGPESRVLTKSVSVPGSTNVGTIKVTTPSTPPLNNAQYTSGISSSNSTSNISNNKLNMEDNVSSKDIKSSSSSISSSLASTVKRDKSHKHNHRSSDDKKSMKSERNAEKRKSSNASLSQIAASAAESSDGDDKDLDKSFEKIKQDRDKSDKLQKERQEKRDKEQRKQQEREEKSRDTRVRDEREEKDRIEKERVENERLHRERLQRERLDKERIEQEGKERKQKEIEQESRERKEREENERRKREEREREEQLQREKERKVRDERKVQEDHTDGKAKDHHRKKVSGFQLQSDVTSDVGALNQGTQNLFRHDEIEQQNKENSAADPLCGSINHTSDNVISKSGKHRSRKVSRNASPIRNPKRRLSSQDSNASICGVNTNNSHVDDYTKRVRIENQVSGTAQPHTNNPNSINSKINERHDFKEQNTKEKVAKHQRQSSSSSHKGAHANEKELNSTSSKYHRNKQQKEKQLQTSLLTQHSGDSIIVAPEHESEIPPTNCINRTEADNHLEQETSTLKIKPSSLQSSDEEGPAQPETPPTIKTSSNIRKHKEHGSGNGVSGHHSRHKGNKREREHHREKKRHSISLSAELLSSTISLGCCNATEEEMITANAASNLQRRTSAHNATYIEMNTKCKHDSLLRSAERKTSRCSDDGPVGGQQPQTPSNRQSNHGKNHHIARRMLLSSAEDSDDVGDQVDENDDDDSDAATKKTSIFDIPDEGPYVSMYDKVKARSCKNMQKQEEEKKIKAKFSQLKQSRAKREEKKRSASYDGDTDSDLDGTESQNRHLSRGGGVYKSPRVISGGLSSTDDDRDQEQNKLSERERRLDSQGSLSAPSVHPNRLYSASDNDSEEQRHLKLQDNIRRLYDGDESSEDELIRRNFNPNFHTNKRLGHHTSRIASDSESQSQSAIDTKFKQEPFDTSADEVSSSPLTKHCQKQFKKEIKNSETLCSMGVKTELNPKDHEIKKEFKELFADNYDKLQPDIKFHKSSVLCSPEVIKVKKHKKSKKRQKTPTHDNFVKDTITADTDVKGSPNSNIIASPLLSLQTDTKNLKILTSPCYDAFDELKRGGTLIAHTTADISTFSEKKRHKDRKEKRREKLRHLNADANTAIEADKIAYEKEKHRLKKSRRSKNVDAVHQNTQMTNIQMTMAAPDACFPFQHKKSGGEKMEDIFGPISDDDDEDVESQFTDSDIGPRDLNCLSARTSSTTNTPGPIVSAALNPYKQEPLTPKSHTVEENEENKQKLCSISASSTPHLERMLERQHRKERRERKRKDREKSRGSELHHNFASAVPSKNVEDENSVDLDAAGRALEAQLMEDSDNKAAEDATPSTATTYRSDMTDVFRFSDGDENSIELETSSRQDRRDADKEHFNQSAKTKEKKKKKKRSKEEKQSHHHQRRESSSSNNSQPAYSANIAKASNVINKLSVDIQAASEHSQINIESQTASSSPLCKPSPSLPCLVGEDDEDAISTLGTKSIINNTGVSNALCTTPQKLSKETLSLSPHIRDKQMISPLPKTPTTGNASRINADSNQKKLGTSTPTSSLTNSMHANTTPPPSSNGSSTKFDELNESIGSINSKSSPSLLSTACSKKKPEIFIPGFDGEIDERISESAVQSISAEFNTTLLDPSADEPKIPVESPPDASKQMEKLEESKSRVTISQEETESAVSALLGESFGNSSADYSLNDDDDGLDSLHTAVAVPESTIAGESEGPDEEAALAAKTIENEVASSAPLTNIEEDSEEICKALQSLRQEEIEIKVDTPLSVRDLQIDTDAEENGEEVDSSGSHCLKIDETAHSNTSSITSDKQDVPVPVSESIPPLTSVATVTVQTSQSSVITKIELPTQTLPAESASQRIDKKMEYSNMSNVEKPSAHHTAQATVSSTDVSLVANTVSTTTTAVSAAASNARSSSVSYISSTPMKTAFTFSPAVTASSTPKQTQSISFKSMSSSQESSYVMQPPTISIPDSAHFAIPQMVLSPRGTINSHHTDSALPSSSLPHSPQTSGTNMPQQSPVGNAYIMNARTQSPHSPRQSSRGNTPIPRQPSPHTSTPPPVIQQQNIVIQRPMQSAVMSPPAVCTQNNSPVTSPSMGQSQRQPSPVGGLQKQSIQLHHQQLSPKASDQEQLTKIKNSSASSVGGSVLNVRSMQQQQEQPNSLYHTSKLGIEQHNLLAGQHMLPVSAQKLPAVPTHSTIISKVVTITPQQAQHSAQNVITSTCNVLPPSSTISQKPCKPIYSSTSTATGANSQRSHQQVMQQTSKTCISSQQSQSTPHSTQVMQSQSPQKQQHMQYTQAQRSQIQQHSPHRHQMQQHMLQIQQQQMIHQHQQKLQQQQQSLMSPSQSHSQSTAQQQQRLAGSPQQAQQTQSQQLQSNVIHSAQTPQRFVVQQHIVGVSSQQHSPQPQQPQSPVAQKQQQHHSQQQQPSQQQDRQFQIVQSKLQQAASPPNSLSLPKQSESEQSSVDSSKPIVSTTNRAPQTSFEKSATPSKENSESPSPLASTINKSSEGVSVICTSNPTTAIAPITKGPNSVATNLTDSARTAPLTEENVVKMSPIIQDEVEQDSKEDSDYWSAKEVNVETNVTSTVIKKVECVTIPQISTNKEDDKQKAKQSIDNEEKSKTSPSASKSESQNAHIGEQSDPIINTEAQTPASPFATAHNLSADNDTEDETETQQMPAFEQVHMSGGSKSGVRGTSKRGRQSRGSKKVGAPSSASGSAVNVDGGSQQADVAMSSTVEISGIQTRLRKPVVTAPITRGRKGRPPRNVMLQQQPSSQGNQQHSVQTAAAPNVVPTTAGQTPMPVLTAAEKKARNQAAAAALASLSEQQDVYEFHDDSGEENKLSSSTTNLTSSTTTTTDSRPRLILTIKSPAQAAQLVKTTEKSASDELPTVDVPSTTPKSNDGQSQETSPKVQSANAATNHTSQQDPLSTETTFANTRKSRRLLEKDRSTIDDIIEDVVRNNATNMALSASGQAACAINALPKGAQTPPRRSGRNATQPKKVTTAEVPTPANPIGRPRKSKERKANDGEAEQSSTQNSGTAIEASESEDGTATTPPATVLPKSLEQSTPSTPEKAQIHTTASQAPVTTTLPQHPKKKALAAAEIESYNAAVTAAAATSTNTMPNLHSALPAGGVPMHNTAAPASQKTTGGAADSLNKPIIDSVTGVVSGVKMQQGKEGSLPLAAAASSLPIIAQTRGPMDPKKIMQAAVAAAAAENNQILPTTQIDNSKVSQKPMIQGAVATPVTALTKPVQAETAAAAAAAATSVATAMLNKSVSVVVKSSASPPIVVQQQIQVTSQSNHSIHIQQHNSQQQQISTQTSAGPATKQPLVVQQQNPVVMHAQQTNVKPPTSLKAHVLNSQKLQQQHQQQQQIIVNQNHSLPKPNGSSAQSQHVIQASIVTRQPIQQQQSAPKQLLVNIPPPSTHSPHGANVSSVNSPRLQSLSHQSGQQSQCQPQRHLQQQQQAIVIKQNQELHHSQVLHVVSSKAPASTQCKQSTPQILQQQQQQQANTQYNTYIQGSTSGQHVQQLQKSQTASTLHQQTASQQKPTSTSLTIPPGILGLPNHPAMIIQAKTTVPTQSPTGSTVTSVVANPHLQQVQHHHHTPSPPLQPQHLPKSLPTTNPLTHNLPSQSGPHVLTNATSASVGSKQQQQVPTPSNSTASIASIRTAAPAISPQGQSRVGPLLLPSGMQVPAHFDANTSDASYPGSGALRGVPTREHYMIYQQMLRSAQQDPLNSTTGLREYEENLMDNSPPLELRRPGSVPRTIAVPHSLQSPQDRATDSPQVAQVYVHNARIAGHAHYNTNANAPTGYYETTRQLTREPPPAHRSAAALPPTVVVPHPSASSSSPFIASVQPPPAPMQTSSNTSGVSGSLRIERERERECEREREHQLQREKEQILARVGDSHLRANTPPPPTAQMPPHSQPPQPTPQADSLLTLLQRYPVMWQGLLALKTDQAAVQMHFVFGNPHVARASLPCNSDGSTPPLRIAQRMRLEQTQLEGVARKMQFENEHCMLLALPCGRDHADVLQQSRNLQTGFITYLQQKMAAGIVNIPMPGSEQAAYVVHIFPSCDFANENLERAAPDLKNRVAELAHLLIVIATV